MNPVRGKVVVTVALARSTTDTVLSVSFSTKSVVLSGLTAKFPGFAPTVIVQATAPLPEASITEIKLGKVAAYAVAPVGRFETGDVVQVGGKGMAHVGNAKKAENRISASATRPGVVKDWGFMTYLTWDS
jgi:hypothetical protein